MMNKTIAALSAVAEAAIILLTDLKNCGSSLIWIIPLLFAGCFVAATALYVVYVYIATWLTIDFEKPNDVPSKFWSRKLEDIADWLNFWGRMKVESSGLEMLPQGRFLMVSNHRSFFDPIVMLPIYKKVQMTYISKPENFKIPIAGRLMHAYGCLPLNRDNNREALMTTKRMMGIIGEGRGSVCIYPEGTRSKKPELLPFHAGSFKSAQKLGCPVVVNVLYGTDRIKHNFPFRKSPVKVCVAAVIDGEYVKTHKTHEIAELAQSIVQKKYDEFADKEQN